jgi:hypothetical protein
MASGGFTVTIHTQLGSFRIHDWRPVENGSIIGFFTISLASGIIIRDCGLVVMSLSCKLAIILPSDGSVCSLSLFSPRVEFRSREVRRRFLCAVLRHLRRIGYRLRFSDYGI